MKYAGPEYEKMQERLSQYFSEDTGELNFGPGWLRKYSYTFKASYSLNPVKDGIDEVVALEWPKLEVEPETWLKSLARKNKQPKRTVLKTLPALTCAAITMDAGTVEKIGPDDPRFLRAANILARCTSGYYDMDALPVFSKKRMERCVRLLEIDLEEYYGMD